MKKGTLFTLLLICLSTLSGLAQYQRDTIEVGKRSGTFYRQNRRITPGELVILTRNNPGALREMQMAKSNHEIGSLFAYSGGLAAGFALGQAIVKGKGSLTLAGIGAGLMLISLPFGSAYNRHAGKAVQLYNGEIKRTGQRKTDFRLGLALNTASLKVSF